MRSIDADHLKSMLQEYIKREQAYIDIGNNTRIAIAHSNGLWEAIAQIDEEPTIEPRKTGKWIQHSEKSREYIGTVLISVEYDYWLCDTCGYRVENGQPMYNFCPNCGADMRGEQDERTG